MTNYDWGIFFKNSTKASGIDLNVPVTESRQTNLDGEAKTYRNS